MVVVFMANGTEDMEAIVPIDLLRRATIEVVTVGVPYADIITSKGVPIRCDLAEGRFVPPADMQAVVLPGGMPGTTNLENSAKVAETLTAAQHTGCTVAAICAAPTILAHRGMLEGHRATVYPTRREELGDSYTDAAVVCDGQIITGCGAGAAVDFALALIEHVKDEETARKVADAICYRREQNLWQK